MSPSPWTFHLHPISLTVLVLAGGAYASAVRRPGWSATPRQVASYSGGLVLALVALTWPLADLASSWSLTALVCQRLILTLGVPPLVILGLPQPVVARLTRPPMIDAVVRACSRPWVAITVFTVVAITTLTTAFVDDQSSTLLVRGALDAILLMAGTALWIPLLASLPGVERPSPLGQAAYLIVQAIVPSFLAIVWIFARHPLYPPFAKSGNIAGVSPVLDQQIAGFVAKFGTIIVLMTVAFVRLSRAQSATVKGEDPDPLRWADVERHLERVERKERGQWARSVWLPSAGRRNGEVQPPQPADHQNPPADSGEPDPDES